MFFLFELTLLSSVHSQNLVSCQDMKKNNRVIVGYFLHKSSVDLNIKIKVNMQFNGSSYETIPSLLKDES